MAVRPTHSARPAVRVRRTIADDDRPDALWDMERSLRRRGFSAVAGADEAGRGACAGPLVAAACVLPSGRRGRVPGLADSKLLTAAARERVYAEVVDRARGLVGRRHAGRRPRRPRHARHEHRGAAPRGAATSTPSPDYVLTDGFPVPGLARPGLAVWKGDRVAACVAAASVLAKVTRDRMMLELHEKWPEYDFAGHKGYITDVHSAALERHGPCPEHRMRFVNVRSARDAHAARGLQVTAPVGMVDDGDMVPCAGRAAMSTEDLEKYETEMELQLYREYRDIVRQFTYVVETERRFYLANSVDLQVREAGGEVYFELKLSDAWVWDMYRPARFVRNVRVLTFKDVNVEELDKPDLELPENPRIT